MQCLIFLEKMSRNLDGLLPEKEVVILESHLAHCSYCGERWNVLQGLDSLISTAVPINPPSDFVSKVMLRLDSYEIADQKVHRVTPLAALAVVSIGTIIILLAGAYLIPLIEFSSGTSIIGNIINAFSLGIALLGALWRAITVIWMQINSTGQVLVLAVSLASLALTAFWARIIFSFSSPGKGSVMNGYSR